MSAFEYLLKNLGDYDTVTITKDPHLRLLNIELVRAGNSQIFRYGTRFPSEEIEHFKVPEIFIYDKIKKLFDTVEAMQLVNEDKPKTENE